MDGLGRRCISIPLEILDSILLLYHFDELFVKMDLLAKIGTVLEGYGDAELFNIVLIGFIEFSMLECLVVFLKRLE